MFRYVLTLGLIAAAVCNYTKAEAECRNATPGQIETAKIKALSAPSAKSNEEEGYLKVQILKPDVSLVLLYFTLAGHPAHPSHVATALYEAEGHIWLYTRGFTAGDCVMFEQWMKNFAEQHERIKRKFEMERSIK